MGFCPITKDECREDCEWIDVMYDMNEDGIERTTQCAIIGIYAAILVGFGYSVGEGE